MTPAVVAGVVAFVAALALALALGRIDRRLARIERRQIRIAIEEPEPVPEGRKPFWQPLPPDEDPDELHERDATSGRVRKRGDA